MKSDNTRYISRFFFILQNSCFVYIVPLLLFYISPHQIRNDKETKSNRCALAYLAKWLGPNKRQKRIDVTESKIFNIPVANHKRSTTNLSNEVRAQLIVLQRVLRPFFDFWVLRRDAA